ncbi:sigma-70 family RNA polymerase sigma factor [Alkalibacillus silvisoli]|uniref:RNA polymerase sigma factor n=1 Tax=Alkalibacillus silvisoli TaxID=392823 RepID=A0ABP3JTG5_9BACI
MEVDGETTRCKDNKLLEDIVSTYDHELYRHCYRMLGCFYDAEEVTQETFLKAYQHLYKFEEINQIKPWLFRIATNLCIDRMRKKKPIAILDQVIKGTEHSTQLEQLESQVLTPEENMIYQEQNQLIWDYIKGLAPKYRSVILLRYFSEFSLNEIAIELNIPVGTVKTRIFRGKEALKQRMLATIKH